MIEKKKRSLTHQDYKSPLSTNTAYLIQYTERQARVPSNSIIYFSPPRNATNIHITQEATQKIPQPQQSHITFIISLMINEVFRSCHCNCLERFNTEKVYSHRFHYNHHVHQIFLYES